MIAEMFSPVGNHPPAVYWRRRLFVVGSAVVLVLLVVLTVNVVSGDDGGPVAASGSSSTTPAGTTARPPSSSATSSTAPTSSSRPPSSTSQSPSGSQSVAPARCAASSLAIEAVAGRSTYKVGAEPVLAVQVTNTGARPCVQDLADKQIVLKVYNGESRVWGSHDCEVQPGAAERTLPVRQSVRVSITWSGRTSQQGCTGTRQQVGAGTYTLYATLAGKSGKAARFTIS